ncbi:MAG TPA: hypothetical protein VMP01_23520 [Pirellulaceae bacterium]|nr:hypothetical protein [Pirellulaceae bacterium]
MDSRDYQPRRWLQFSLRTLFVLMLVVASFFGGRESMRPVIRAERDKARRDFELAERERALAELSLYMAQRQQAQIEFQRLLKTDSEQAHPEGRKLPDSP